MEINLEKFITSLLNTKVNIPEVNIAKRMIEKALEEQGLKYYNGSILERDNKPKFKVGDWMVNKLGDAWHIDSFDKKNYQVSDRNGNYNYFPISKQDEMHLWTIKDAKPGDVISNGGLIIIFKKFKHPSTRHLLIAYAGIDGGGKLQVTDNYWAFSDSSRLATKEQRNVLFDKIWADGYAWDSDNMELRYIGPCCTTRPEVDAWVETLKTSVIPLSKDAWGNENARKFDRVCQILNKAAEDHTFQHKLLGDKECAELIAWVTAAMAKNTNYDKGFRDGFSAAKSYQWKPSDQEISAIEWQLKNTSEGSWQYQKTKEVLENLKKLVEELKKAL